MENEWFKEEYISITIFLHKCYMRMYIRCKEIMRIFSATPGNKYSGIFHRQFVYFYNKSSLRNFTRTNEIPYATAKYYTCKYTHLNCQTTKRVAKNKSLICLKQLLPCLFTCAERSLITAQRAQPLHKNLLYIFNFLCPHSFHQFLSISSHTASNNTFILYSRTSPGYQCLRALYTFRGIIIKPEFR